MTTCPAFTKMSVAKSPNANTPRRRFKRIRNGATHFDWLYPQEETPIENSVSLVLFGNATSPSRCYQSEGGRSVVLKEREKIIPETWVELHVSFEVGKKK